jgi:hypothetical protein
MTRIMVYTSILRSLASIQLTVLHLVLIFLIYSIIHSVTVYGELRDGSRSFCKGSACAEGSLCGNAGIFRNERTNSQSDINKVSYVCLILLSCPAAYYFCYLFIIYLFIYLFNIYQIFHEHVVG